MESYVMEITRLRMELVAASVRIMELEAENKAIKDTADRLRQLFLDAERRQAIVNGDTPR